MIIRPTGIILDDGARRNYTMLDNLTDLIGPVKLLDIDMYGSEIDVLKGAVRTIIMYKPDVIVTLHEDRIMKERERIIAFFACVLGLPINIEEHTDMLYIYIRDTDIAETSFRGHKFKFYRNRGPEPIMYFTGWTSEVKLREKLLRPDEVVYDLGAHIGGWTIPAALISKHVEAFEPNIDCVQILNQNLNLNKLTDKVTVHNVGLGGKINSCFNDNNTSDSSTLDEMVWGQALTPPSFIKIDVEGAELEVLRGAQETIQTFRPRIFVEAHTIDGHNTYDKIIKMVMELVPEYHIEFDRGSWCIFYL